MKPSSLTHTCDISCLCHPPATQRPIESLHNLLPTAVSDSHHVFELGRTYTDLPEFDGTPEGFKLALKDAVLTESQATPWVHLLSSYAKLHKRVTNAFNK